MVTLCAVIAAYNEEQHVAEVVAGAAGWAAPVIVVDDGSSDATGMRARAAGATVIRHERNLGKGCAIRTGLAQALQHPCSHVLFLDADMQHDPGEIPRLVEQAERGIGDFVLAERDFAKGVMPPARFYTNIIGSRILSSFIGMPVSDSQSGFRLIRSDLLRKVALTGSGYEIETEMLIKLAGAGARLERIKVARLRYDGVRSHLRPFRDTFRTCMLALRYRYLTSRS
jgi:glycosyltransferase involved in cell wall biosynthesis